MRTSRNVIEKRKSAAIGKLASENSRTTREWELPSGEGLAEFAIHAGFVASLLMASSAIGTASGELGSGSHSKSTANAAENGEDWPFNEGRKIR